MVSRTAASGASPNGRVVVVVIGVLPLVKLVLVSSLTCSSPFCCAAAAPAAIPGTSFLVPRPPQQHEKCAGRRCNGKNHHHHRAATDLRMVGDDSIGGRIGSRPTRAWIRRRVDAASSLLNESVSLQANKNSSWRTCLMAILTMAFATLSPLAPPSVASAADYGSLSSEQMVVAEAWRIVDNVYLDRTFGGQDWFQLRQDLVKKVKYKNLQEAHNSIASMVSTLGDKYTRYLSPSQYQSIVSVATGTSSGVGVEISLDKTTSQVFVSNVEPSSPAAAAGIAKGDVFVQVDGTVMNDGRSTPEDVAAKLRGPENSKVGVLLSRNGGAETLDLILTRKPIQITTVSSYKSNVPGFGNVGVIRIKNFSATTASTVAKAMDSFGRSVKAIVLDVRSNPGGLLPGGVDTASLFLPANNPVVFVVNSKGIVDAQRTLADGVQLELPLVVVVNDQTASAAEVLTAALQENARATVVGTTPHTFGKGIVQTIRPLSDPEDNGGLAVTVARYETPRHHDINQRGIPADVTATAACVDNAAVAVEDAAKCIPANAFRPFVVEDK